MLDKVIDIIKGLGNSIASVWQHLWFGNSIKVADSEVDELVEALAEQGITMESLGMVATEEDAKDDEEDEEDENVEKPKIEITKEQRKYLKEFILASKITTSFYSSNTGLIGWLTNSNVGAIKIYRIGENGKKQLLTRVDETQLMPTYAEQEASDEWLTYFAVDEHSKMYIATKDRATGAFSKQEVEFFDGVLNENAISVMFFIDLCLTTQNPKYVSDIAKYVIKNTNIEIWLLENGQTTTVTTTVPDGDNLLWFKVDSVTRTQDSSEDIRAIVGKAQTLLYEYERDIISNVEPSERNEEEKDIDGNVIKKIKTETYTYYNIKGVYKNARVRYKESDPFPKYSNTEYEILNSKGVQTAYKSLEDGGDNMFENMSRNVDNDRLVQVLKYVMYKMTNRSYGVTELDLDLNDMIFSFGDFKVSTDEEDIPVVTDREQLIDIFAQRNGIEKGTYDYSRPSLSEISAIRGQIIASGSNINPQYKLLNFKYVVDDILEAQETYRINALFLMAVGEIESNTGADGSNKLINNSSGQVTWNWVSMEKAISMYGGWANMGESPYPGRSVLGWWTNKNADESSYHDWSIYDNPGTGYLDFAHYSSVRVGQGIDTVSAIGERYCNAAWAESVKKIIIEFCNAGGLEIDIEGSGSGGTVMGASIGEVTLKGANKQKMINMLNKAVEICDDPNVRYSQAYREQTIGGITYWDCSSFVHYLYQTYFGMSVPEYTGGYEDNGNEAIKAARKYPMSANNRDDISWLKPGDVLWRSGHVAIYIGNGLIAHARGDESWGLYGQDQVAVCTLGTQAQPFTKAYRFVE